MRGSGHRTSDFGLRTGVLIIAASWASAAHADEPPRLPAHDLLVGVKAGGTVPAEMHPGFSAGLEAGWVVPAWAHRVAVVASLDYAQPTADASGEDPRLAAGMFDAAITQRQLAIGVGAMVRLGGGGRITPFAGGGPRLFLLETRASGASDTAPFGSYTETSLELGAAVFGGAEWSIGPGGLVGELGVSVSDLDHLTTGDTSTTALSVRIGYRLWL